MGGADEVIPEPPGGAHSDWDAAAAAVETSNKEDKILKQLEKIESTWTGDAAQGVE